MPKISILVVVCGIVRSRLSQVVDEAIDERNIYT
jgi:hypothetical protein